MKSVTFVVVALVLSMAFRPSLYGAERAMDTQDPMTVIQRYLRATYARDFVAAYRFISAEDRNVRDVNRYVQQRGPYSGFILDAARKLSEFIEVGTLNAQESPRGVRVAIKYRVPDPQKIAPLLLNWDPRRLNSLPAAERKQIIDALDQRKQQGSLEMSEGTETFELIREADEWRVFLNWAAGVKIPLKLDLSKSPDLDVVLSKNEFVVQPGDLFEIVLKIKNRTQQPMTVRIGHLVEPSTIADYLDFVQCGFLLPVTVQPDKEQEFSGTYMLRGSLPEGVRGLNLTYDFRQLK
ncbi:MAG TPA: cytochrome c oxidase assembly protein [Candidatus Limnocylindrales bacterium]|nr:cytochrome c oxidase assembly protein [Candidatus Limnocylindrales bacterium]